MKNKILNNKLLSILIVFLLVVFIFTSFVFASSSNDLDFSYGSSSFPSSYVSLGDDGYYIINGQNTVCDRFFTFNDGNNGTFVYFFVNDFTYNSSNKTCYFKDTSIYNYSYIVVDNSGKVTYILSPRCSSSARVWGDFLYSTHDILLSDGSVFFQGPSALEKVMKEELAEKKTTKEIVEILPLIIVVVVSFLGLRKALKMLSTFLNRS